MKFNSQLVNIFYITQVLHGNFVFIKVYIFSADKNNGGVRPMNVSEFQICIVSSPKRYPMIQNRVTGRSSADPQTHENIHDKSSSSKYVVEDNRIVYEKYDRHGKLICKIPWIRKPVDAIA